MKHACLVLNNSTNACDTAYMRVSDSFRKIGFAFLETRIVTDATQNYVQDTLTQLKNAYDTVLLLTDKSGLPFAKDCVCQVFENAVSVAQGAEIFDGNGKYAFVLTADDTEYGCGFVKTVETYLAQKRGVRRGKCTFRCVSVSDERVDSLIAQAKRMDNGAFEYTVARALGEVVIEIFYGENASKMLVDDITRLFAEGLGDTVYALDDTPLPVQLVRMLKIRGKRISVAESFTGGRIARVLTAVSGASEVYFEGLNTYNEASKQKRLGVSEYTLKTFGAVSDQTAYEMATGLLATGDCDIAIATTGLAGPNTDKSGLPVGLCYIAIGTQERVFVYKYKFEGTREEICEQGVNYALYQAYKQLKNI